jgi:hypothetical protein
MGGLIMERKLKHQSQYRQMGKYYRNFYVVPKLILSGKWLEDAGFAAASEVQVECRNKQLIITSI